MPINPDSEFTGRYADVLFATFSTRDEVYNIGCVACKLMSNWVLNDAL